MRPAAGNRRHRLDEALEHTNELLLCVLAVLALLFHLLMQLRVHVLKKTNNRLLALVTVLVLVEKELLKVVALRGDLDDKRGLLLLALLLVISNEHANVLNLLLELTLVLHLHLSPKATLTLEFKIECHEFGVKLLFEGKFEGLTLLSDLVEEITEEANLIHEVLVDVDLLLFTGLGLEVEILRNLEDVFKSLLVGGLSLVTQSLLNLKVSTEGAYKVLSILEHLGFEVLSGTLLNREVEVDVVLNGLDDLGGLVLEVLTGGNEVGKLLAADSDLLREHGNAIIIGRHREARLGVAMLDTHTLDILIIDSSLFLSVEFILEASETVGEVHHAELDRGSTTVEVLTRANGTWGDIATWRDWAWWRGSCHLRLEASWWWATLATSWAATPDWRVWRESTWSRDWRTW